MRSRVLLVLPLLAAVAATQPPTGPSLIILNARVFTGVPATPWVEALSVAGDRIGVVGATDAVRALATASTRVIDAGGRLVVPGLNDAHIHMGGMPAHVRLAGPPAIEHDPPLDEVLERVKAAVQKASNDAWVFGEIAARVLDDPAATRFALDAVAPNVPVALTAWTGHGTLFNTAALRVLGVRDDEPDPPGGVFERMPGTKTVSGKAHEYAQYILFQRLSGRVTAESHVAALRAVAAQAGGWGITSLQVMANGESVPALAKIVAAAGVEQRIRLIEFPMDGMTAWRARRRDAAADGVVVSGTKWILDGTPVERLMFLREPYSDRQSTRGALNFQPREIDGFLRRALAAREQPMFHAVGDAAIDAVLAALERTGGDAWQPLRPRLEHADGEGPADCRW
jgi:predicted amidohydrolase YtcJ